MRYAQLVVGPAGSGKVSNVQFLYFYNKKVENKKDKVQYFINVHNNFFLFYYIVNILFNNSKTCC